MEPIKQTSGTGLFNKVLILSALMTIPGLQLLAQNSSSAPGTITAGEIAMYVAIIIVVIGVAWFFASRQTDKIDKEHREEMSHHAPKKHYDHPNDPHFRKLRKKTS